MQVDTHGNTEGVFKYGKVQQEFFKTCSKDNFSLDTAIVLLCQQHRGCHVAKILVFTVKPVLGAAL